MDRLYLKLDPGGYTRLSEPGWDHTYNADALATYFHRDQVGPGYVPSKFYSPPGSEWIMPIPRQWHPDWYKDPRLGQHVIRQADWTFAAGVRPSEWEPTRQPNDTTPPEDRHNWWLSVYTGEFSPLTSTNFVELGLQMGFDLSEVNVFAMTNKTPYGGRLDEADHCPYLKILQYPSPNDRLVFGWSNLAVLFERDAVVVARSPENDGTNWEVLAWVNLQSTGPLRGAEKSRVPQIPQEAPSLGDRFNAGVRVAGFLPVGYDTLYIHLSDGAVHPVRLRDAFSQDVLSGHMENPTPRLFPPGPWWLAAAPNQRHALQVQVMGYEIASTADVAGSIFAQPGQELTMFDLGGTYKPTEQPVVAVFGKLDMRDADDITESISGGGSGLLQLETTTTNEVLSYAVRDEANNVWDSDGNHSRGHVYLYLQPGHTGDPADIPDESPGYLAPQVRKVQLRFPEKRSERPHATLLLNDTQFAGVRVEAALYEPNGKRFSAVLFDVGAGLLEGAGLHERNGYPVHLMSDTNGDGIPVTILAKGWIGDPDTDELFTGEDVAASLNVYQLRGKGLLCRADERWTYIPELIDPDGKGYVEHHVAVREALAKSKFDVTDAAAVYLQTDPHAGTDIAKLPGTADQIASSPGQDVTDPWAPDWDETRLGYCERVATEWRGWRLFEELAGRVVYCMDLMIATRTGLPYYVSATIYRTSGNAELAGYPGQYYLAPQRLVIEPEGNVVRVTGTDPKQRQTPQVIDKDRPSIDDIHDENFIGDEKSISLVPKLAVGSSAASQIARVRRLRAARRRRIWKVTIPLAPWQVEPNPLDVGRVLTLEGKGDFLIIHLELGYRTDDSTTIFWTRLACEKLNGSAVASSIPGDYPGGGEPEEDEE